MGKLPTTILYRPRAAAGSLLLSSTTTAASPASSGRCMNRPQSLLQHQHQQTRHATYVLRPRRGYKFTQLVQLSDGSTFTVRTTSPQPLYRSAKDSRNHLVWQPSEKSLRNVEVDEAGKLAAFRDRFGRAWDLEATPVPGAAAASDAVEDGKTTGGSEAVEASKKEAEKQASAPAAAPAEDATDVLGDLLSGYAAKEPSWRIGGMSNKGMGKEVKKKRK